MHVANVQQYSGQAKAVAHTVEVKLNKSEDYAVKQ
jgi:hypothetical protein